MDDNECIVFHDYFTFLEGKNKGKKLKAIGAGYNRDNGEEWSYYVKNLETGEITKIKASLLTRMNPVCGFAEDCKTPVDSNCKNKQISFFNANGK